MASMGKDIGSETLVYGNIAVTAAAVATVNGKAVNIAALPARPQSVRAHMHLKANLDSTDTLVIDNVKLVSDTSSSFSSPVTRVTAADQTLTGTATDTDYWGDVDLDYDLTQLPEAHTWIRLTARVTLSDTTNTTGVVTGTLVFGGLSVA